MVQFIEKRFSTGQIVALQKLVQAGTGAITAAFVVTCLTSQEQGYYVTMGSLLSSYTLLDLGLSLLLVQLSARYFAGLQWSSNGSIEPVGFQSQKFLSLLRWSLRWYSLAGGMTLALIPGGWIYFHYAAANNGQVNWQLPWISIVTAIALGMPAVGFLAVLEGAGRIRSVYLLRVGHYVVGAMSAWVLFLSGNGLFAQAMAPLVMAVMVIYWSKRYLRNVLDQSRDAPNSVSWRRDIWPQHKKIALTWFNGYLFLHIPVPILFYCVGATQAGQMGLSMTVANVMGAVAMSPVTAVAPSFTTLVVQHKLDQANQLFRSAFVRSIFLLLSGSASFVLAAWLVRDGSLGIRILKPLQLVLLLAVFASFHAFNGLGIYFRAFGKEPIALPGLIAALSQASLGWLAIRYFGVEGLLLTMLLIYLLLAVYVVAYRLRQHA